MYASGPCAPLSVNACRLVLEPANCSRCCMDVGSASAIVAPLIGRPWRLRRKRCRVVFGAFGRVSEGERVTREPSGLLHLTPPPPPIRCPVVQQYPVEYRRRSCRSRAPDKTQPPSGPPNRCRLLYSGVILRCKTNSDGGVADGLRNSGAHRTAAAQRLRR